MSNVGTAEIEQPLADPKRLAALAQSVAKGELVIPIVARLPLAQVREAQTMVEQGAAGKVVLRVG